MVEQEKPKQFEFLPLTLSIETLGGLSTPLVKRGTPLPAIRSQTFSTATDNQPSVEIKVLLGERPLANKNLVLGKHTCILSLKLAMQFEFNMSTDRISATGSGDAYNILGSQKLPR